MEFFNLHFSSDFTFLLPTIPRVIIYFLANPLFLGNSGTRTLFSIDCKTGVKIQHLSAYETEAEVLLAAGTRFVVANTIKTGDLTVVNLKEVGSGLPPTCRNP